MTTHLDKISIGQKTGAERLTFNNIDTGFNLIDFWKWSVSDLVSNATRGRFAEFIVASALNVDLTSVRDEWSNYDLITPEGIKVEVKSAAFIQSWKQREYSRISFSIKAARSWDPESLNRSGTPERPSDVYVFCLLNNKDQETLNPLNLDQWKFYVVSTIAINNQQSNNSITLAALEKLSKSINYDQLQKEILKIYFGK